MLGFAARGEVAAESHRNGARDDFGDSGGDHKIRCRYGTRQPRRKRERYRETVRHADDCVAHDFARSRVFFHVAVR